MSKKMKKGKELSRIELEAFDSESSRRVARDAHRAKFWDGLRAEDRAVREMGVPPQERITIIVGGITTQFEAHDVPTMLFCWNVIDYLGSFDMEYDYQEMMGGNIGLSSDSIDEVTITAFLREALTRMLAAGGALARDTGSSTYEDWVKLLEELNITHRSSYHVFDKDWTFADFYKRFEELLHHLWADNEIARTYPPRIEKGAKIRRERGGGAFEGADR